VSVYGVCEVTLLTLSLLDVMKASHTHTHTYIQKNKNKTTSYQDCDALFFAEHRHGTQREADHNPPDRKPVISVALWGTQSREKEKTTK